MEKLSVRLIRAFAGKEIILRWLTDEKSDNVKKTVKTVFTFIVFALTLALVVLRSVQLCLYTDSFGLIVKGAERTIAAFYLIASLLYAADVFSYTRKNMFDV